MQDADLIEARKRAEKIVEDMPDGAIKRKRFELAFEQILRGESEPSPKTSKTAGRARLGPEKVSEPTTGPGRILALKQDGFFGDQKSNGDVVAELKARGWHYPSKTIATRLQELVQQRQLRRISVSEGKKKIWKYS